MGIDAGTSGIKAVVMDETGKLWGQGYRECTVFTPKPNWAEQDPSVILRAILDGIRELLTQVSPSDIACIGLSGTMNGCIAVDAGGRALYPNIIHSDSRAWREAKQMGQVIDPLDFYRLTGNRLDHHYTLPKILWLRANRPEVYKRTRWWLNTKDYIYAHLTGRVGFTEYSDASLTVALDINKGVWAQDLLKELGVDPGKMPTCPAPSPGISPKRPACWRAPLWPWAAGTAPVPGGARGYGPPAPPTAASAPAPGWGSSPASP